VIAAIGSHCGVRHELRCGYTLAMARVRRGAQDALWRRGYLKPIEIHAVAIVAATVLLAGGVDATSPSPNDKSDSDTIALRRMPDGEQWTTHNLNVDTGSFCHTDTEWNCVRYGRLYTWESAKLACRSLGDGWRLPTNDDWQQAAKHFGGIRDDSADVGKRRPRHC
jgi:hypothetical protein